MGSAQNIIPKYSLEAEKKAYAFLDKITHCVITHVFRNNKSIASVITFIFAFLIVFFLLMSVFNTYTDFAQKVRSILVPSQQIISPIAQLPSPQNLDEAKAQQALKNGCTTTNNFESNVWDTRAMRIVEKDPDTGDPITYGVQKNDAFQSLMVFKIQCPLPLIATISAEMQNKNSYGLIFEYDNVFQVIVGDGDVRSVRYKVHSEEKRQSGWKYVYGDNGKKITHWLPENQKIASGSEIGLTVNINIVGNGKIEISVGLSYKPIGGGYTSLIFPPIHIETYKYDTVQNIGRFIRVGLNDYSYEGNEAIIAPLRFSIISGQR